MGAVFSERAKKIGWRPIYQLSFDLFCDVTGGTAPFSHQMGETFGPCLGQQLFMPI